MNLLYMSEKPIVPSIRARLSVKKYILVLLPVIFILAGFNILPPALAICLAAFVVLYVFLSHYAWVLITLIPLGVALGTIISIEITTTWIYEISFGEIFLFASLAALLLDTFFYPREAKLKMKPIGWFLLLYVVMAALSFWHVKSYELYVAGLKVCTLSFMAYFLGANLLTTPKRLRIFFYGVAAAIALLSIEIFVTFFNLKFSSALFYERNLVRIPLGAIALVASILAFILPLLLTFYFHLNKAAKARFFVLVSFILGFVAIFMMLGKAALLSFGVAMAYLFAKLRPKRIIFVLFVCLFALIGYISLGDYATGLVNRLTHINQDTSTEFRILEYQTAFHIIKEYPWFGIGSGQQLAFYQRAIDPEYRQLINSYWLQALVDYGTVGLAVYLGIMISVWLFIRRRLKEAARQSMLHYGLAAALIAAAINGLAEVTIFALPYAIFLWLTIGAFANLSPQLEKKV